MTDYAPLLKLAIHASINAGEEILKIYNTNFEVEIKKYVVNRKKVVLA